MLVFCPYPENKTALQQPDTEEGMGDTQQIAKPRYGRNSKSVGNSKMLALKIFESEGFQEPSQLEQQCWKTHIKQTKIRKICMSPLSVFHTKSEKEKSQLTVRDMGLEPEVPSPEQILVKV